ncbi:PREDICTED: zinc finger CCCH domain-containing protein 14-like [Amphimedon queenslandica]|uniref:Zinc finger CCCH domain-containing protein 14 n=1 Tax=Amphimedon queenslandica TaxID=400682 RepID=A0A1X7UY20_AMPQE|nr:PREDICTED: zinc finger CCCH domain-containing protein 14-like [Amphimedon queenslandica]|eukprot:XP_003386363.2 PREDICTED: zinc finger CCCH domain-containing protein 14-like [Amphimedon queenslandica]
MDHHNAIRSGIIDKLKDFNAYIDNELPDYIMVMLANKKTMNQISTDLQLFLGENTDQFIDWLKKVVSDPSLLTREDSPSSSPDRTHSLSPVRKRSSSQTSSQSNSVRRRRSSSLDRPVKVSRQEDKNEHDDEHDDDDVPAATIQRIKLPPEEKKYNNNSNNEHHRKGETGRGTRGGDEPRRSRDQDLRSLIRRRKAESGISDESRVVSSVVQVPDKPDRPKESRGTSRLLQRAIHDIHGRHNSKRGERRGGRERDQKGARTQNKSEETRKEEVLADETDYVNDLHNNEGGKEEEYENDTVTVSAPLTNEDEDEEKQQAMSEKDDNEQLKAITPDKVEAATIAAIRKVLPTEDLRLFLNKGKSVNKSSSSDNSGTGTRFIVKMDDTAMEGDEGEEEEEEGEESARQGKGGLSERCRFWPNCKNGDSCPFHHPTVPCRMFPNCKFGQKCCFVHPVCKFDGRCMKPDCPYLHTVPKPKAISPRVMAAPFRMPTPFMLGGPSMMYIGGGVGGRVSHRYPNKQSLKWTPNKHLSERKFAVADSDTSSMSVQ